MYSQLEILICAAIWGLSPALIKWSHLQAPQVLAIRFFLPCFLSYIFIRLSPGKLLGRISAPLFAVSIFNVLGSVLFTYALFLTTISNAILVLYIRPVLATLLAAIFLGERPSARIWLSLLISLFGVALIVSPHPLSFKENDFLGMFLAFGAALVTSIMWAIVKRHGYGERSTLEIVFYQHLAGAVLSVPVLPSLLAYSGQNVAIGTLYSVSVGFVAVLLYFHGLRNLALSKAMPLTYLELIGSVSTGILFFGEQLVWQSVLGAILILLGASIATISFNGNRLGKSQEMV